MSKISAFRPGLNTALKTSTVAGLAAVMLATGIPARISQSFADPVSVQAPQVASFADVVQAVSPAVVSVRGPGSNAWIHRRGTRRGVCQAPSAAPRLSGVLGEQAGR